MKQCVGCHVVQASLEMFVASYFANQLLHSELLVV
jgi:hypothetical protein